MYALWIAILYNIDMHHLDSTLAHLKVADPVLYEVGKTHQSSVSPLKKTRGADRLFASLAEAVVSQQLSVKAADTIWIRLKAICGGAVTAESIRATPPARLRRAGLSAAKVKTLKELAKAVSNGLHLPALRNVSKDEAIERLTQIWGIGPWTCEMFLMFSLGHEDIFSARDLGLVRAMETIYKLPRGTSLKKLEAIAECWSPYRSYVCRILWRSRDVWASSLKE